MGSDSIDSQRESIESDPIEMTPLIMTPLKKQARSYNSNFSRIRS